MTHLCSQSSFWEYGFRSIQPRWCTVTQKPDDLVCGQSIIVLCIVPIGSVTVRYIYTHTCVHEGGRLFSDEDLHVSIARHTELRSLDVVVQLRAGSLPIDAHSSAQFESEAIHRRNSSSMWQLHRRSTTLPAVVLTQSTHERPVQ